MRTPLARYLAAATLARGADAGAALASAWGPRALLLTGAGLILATAAVSLADRRADRRRRIVVLNPARR